VFLKDRSGKTQAGKILLERYWVGAGGIGSAEVLQGELKKLNLSNAQLRDLQDSLPLARGSGTTGQRIETADRVLVRMGR